MKIATYNIWNSNRGMPLREKQIIKEIKSVNSDIFCLQEVREEVYKSLKKETDYKYSYYHQISNEYDGLAIFSKVPILTSKYLPSAIFITCEFENNTYLVINVHLPSESIFQQEERIVEIVKESEKIKSDYTFLVGDFNCSDHSSVHHYITGQTTLLNTEATPYWNDLAEAYADMTNTTPENTLNLRTNPRWKGKDYAVKSERVDKIYNRDSFPKPFPELVSFSVFGKEIDEASGYCGSDHYGLVAEISVD